MEKTTLGGTPVRHLKLDKRNGFSIIIGEIKTPEGRWTSIGAYWKMDGTWAGGAGKMDLKLEDIPERYETKYSHRIVTPIRKKSEEMIS
jgi:hypothetical protein